MHLAANKPIWRPTWRKLDIPGFSTVTSTVASDRKFQLFSRLPLELRRDIWDTFLQEHRILHIGVRSSDRPDPAGSYTQKNHLGNIRSGKNYSLSIDKYHSDSPLLRVSSEARAAALAFYRVHLPCSQGLDAVTSRILYFNPDFDFLHVQILVTGEHEHTEVPLAPPDLLADVFYDCKAYDPKGHGIRNLMVGRRSSL
ncbi:hypothetical protein N656DRAFT_802440 [Canariomyces notabilis]|uniref:2EXR domain-containing protein n=1 Tax=Canariomyces notabilis TaxID=2074819 RepID=A0AAN6QCJ1_9PEZI|nr:hypothetical protein N656DRAFT_802440 [Canariomyces arenarius]